MKKLNEQLAPPVDLADAVWFVKQVSKDHQNRSGKLTSRPRPPRRTAVKRRPEGPLGAQRYGV